jgi:uncharacterized protein YhaN
MRLLTLHLERYGHFTDKILNFRTDACLHVVYGPNEAGKSSSLEAVKDLFFGFGARTQYDFLHPGNRLSLGATIVGKNGQRLSFKRRKGNKNTITDDQGSHLPDDILSAYLGPLTRPIFSNAFGLSTETLREGAEEMLKSGGDAGSSLFAAASGLKGLNELRKRLAEEAMEIFAPTKAKDRSFYQARDRFEEANKQIRTLELKDRDLRERRAHIERLNGELKSIREKRADAVKRREQLARQRDIAPLLRSIAADEAEVLVWNHLPSMDSSRVLQLRNALDSVDESAAELARLREEETSAKLLADSLLPDEALLEMGPAIQLLLAGTGNYATQRGDVSRVQGEADKFQEELDDLRTRLGLPPSTDLSNVRPSDLLVVRLWAQIKQGTDLERELQGNKDMTGKEEDALERLRKQQAGHTPILDPKEHRSAFGRLKSVPEQLTEIERLERSVRQEAGQIKEKALQLFPAITDLGALAQHSLPTAEIVENFATSIAMRDGALSSLRDRINAKTAAIPGLEARVHELSDGRPVASADRILDARSTRDSSWQPLRSALLSAESTPTLAETADRLVTFESAVEGADRLADEAIADADRLAEHASAVKRVDEEKGSLKDLADELVDAEGAAADQEQEWQKLWESFGFKPALPRSMSPWLTQVRDLLERRSKHQREEIQLEQLQTAVEEARPSLDQLAIALHIQEPEKLPMALLFQAVKSELETREELWRGSNDLVMRTSNAIERIAELTETRASLTAEQGEWQSEWLKTLQLLHLGPDTSIIEAGAALELWQKVPAALTQFEDRSRRVRGMKRDMQTFEDSTNAMLLQLEMSDPGVGGPDATVKMLSNKLTQAQQIEAKASVARDRLEDATGKVAAADRIARTASSNLEALAADLPNIDSLPEQIGNLEAREKVHERLRQRRETLVPLSRGETETALRDTLTSFDEDGALAEIEELKRQDAQYNDSENKAYAELSDKERELATLEAGVGAEVALQMRKNAEAELTQNARAWAIKRLGQILLAHAIEQHRSQQEQPLMRRASQLFSMLTAQSFTSIEQEFDDKDTLRLVGRRDADHTVGVAAMSEGTRDQLYLALRLAYLEEYADRTEPIPFIGDDLVTSFDDERTTQGLKALAATGGHIQPILFTHHKRVVELAQAELGNIVDIVALA